jgi:hypothetical protein
MAASGEMPLDYMIRVVRYPTTEPHELPKRSSHRARIRRGEPSNRSVEPCDCCYLANGRRQRHYDPRQQCRLVTM